VVATVLRLRYRILGNVLMRNPWQLVGFVLGALWAAGMLVLVVPLLFLLGGTGLEITRSVIVIAGGVLTLGWVVAPILIGGIDTSVDAGRLAPFPFTTTQIMVAVTAVGLLGVGGIATLLGGLATFAAWVRWPVAAAAAVVCVPLGVLVCVVASRLVAAFAGRGGGRRLGEVLGMVFLGALVLTGPIIIGILNLLGGTQDLGARVTAIAEVASWTPIAAAWAVPGDLASGHPLAALAKLGIVLVTLAALWFVWHRTLAAAAVAPVRSAARAVRAGSLGWFGRVPTGATGATLARALMYWLHDPRYLRNLAMAPLLPVAFAFAGGGIEGGPFLFSAVISAAILSLVPYGDVSYDGTAFAGVLATGIRGRSDRAGRMLAAAIVGVPLITGIAVVTAGIAGRWDALPAVLGAALGVLLIGHGLCAVTSAVLIFPVPESGDNMFKRVPGSQVLSGFAFFGLLLATVILALPGLVTAIVALVRPDPALGWVALAIGLVVGAAVFVGGVFVGGHVFDRNAPVLMQRIRSLKGV